MDQRQLIIDNFNKQLTIDSFKLKVEIRDEKLAAIKEALSNLYVEMSTFNEVDARIVQSRIINIEKLL
jgi:uncharacterized protein (DUF1786 family)